jgi:hypothetical protein
LLPVVPTENQLSGEKFAQQLCDFNNVILNDLAPSLAKELVSRRTLRVTQALLFEVLQDLTCRVGPGTPG